ncbi:putative translation factor pelota [Oesophagostomum dentatum]|uniref:Putative translation factor pelota n=1 Tax=Oesophagostomum dentatum TaxID=61180 RepID=A0A0B1SQP4_OESDE|nr:putative translation factor pelota [Oesophagostomum dentatum]
MWHIYNLIRVGDVVRSKTIRKVVTETATGTTSSQRMHTVLTVRVESIDFDPGANALHLKGRNIVENDLVKLGAYHTLDLEPNRQFSLEKTEWDIIDIERLDVALDPAAQADVAAVVLHEGLANVCLLTPAMTLVRAKIDMQIPRKRKGFTSQHEKGIKRFLDAVSAAFLRHVNLNVNKICSLTDSFQIVKCVLIASRGFLKEQFLEHLLQYADAQGKKITTEQRGKFMLTHSSSGFKHALKEVLEDPAVAARLADTKAQGEVKALNTFFELMSTEPDRAFYGYKHVSMANAEQAIDTLLLSDSLFRSQDLATRKKYVALVESVREQKLHVFSESFQLREALFPITFPSRHGKLPVRFFKHIPAIVFMLMEEISMHGKATFINSKD